MKDQDHLAILKQGVSIWNKWRVEHLDIQPDLSGADLSGADLSGANLNGADLSGANLSGATLNEAILSGADLRNAVLWATDLSTAQLSATILNGAYISEQQQEMLRDRDVIGVHEIKVVTLPRIITPNSSNTIQESRETMSAGTNSEHSANSEPKNPRNEPGPSDIAHLIEEISRLSTKQKNEIRRTLTPKTVFWKDIMAGGVAIFAVLGFASLTILIATLLSNAAMSDVQWERYTFLLAGVETITFTAIGWLFGQEVHREQAQQAELRANETQKAMDTVVQENAKGRMVAKAVMVHAKDKEPNMDPLVEMVHTAYPDM